MGNLGLDKPLFLMDPKCLDLSKLSCLYQHVFKIWSFFHVQRNEHFHSIFWLLNEPLIFKARLDLTESIFLPGLSYLLKNSGICTLNQLLCIAGPHFKNVEAVREKLGIRSVRFLTRYLTKLKEVFTDEEKMMLEDIFRDKYP